MEFTTIKKNALGLYQLIFRVFPLHTVEKENQEVKESVR